MTQTAPTKVKTTIEIGYKYKHLRTKSGKVINKYFIIRSMNKSKVFYSYVKANKVGDSAIDLEEKVYSFNRTTIQDKYHCEPIRKTKLTTDFKLPYNFIFSEMNNGKDLSCYADNTKYCIMEILGLIKKVSKLSYFERKALNKLKKVYSLNELGVSTNVPKSTVANWVKKKDISVCKSHFYKMIPFILPFIADEMNVIMPEVAYIQLGLEVELKRRKESGLLKTNKPFVQKTTVTAKLVQTIFKPSLNERYMIENVCKEVTYVGKEGIVLIGDKEKYITFEEFNNDIKEGKVVLAFDSQGEELINWQENDFNSFTKDFFSISQDKEGNIFANNKDIKTLMNDDKFHGCAYADADDKNYLHQGIQITNNKMTHVVFHK